jgi:hypothetical protein
VSDRPRKPHQAPTTIEQANLVQQQLVALVRRLAREQGVNPTALDDVLTLPLQIAVRPARQWELASLSRPLYRQLQHIMAELAAATDAFQPGRVYSFRAGNATSADAVPPSPTAVFAGYASTGAPFWTDLHQALLDAGDERVGLLFADKPRILSLITRGRDLKAQLLSVRGRLAIGYNILGQIAAGYYLAPNDQGMPERFAVTAQIVETRSADRTFRLALNLIGRMPDGTPLHDAVLHDRLPELALVCRPVATALRRCERAVRALPQDAPDTARTAVLGCIPQVLARMAERLQRCHRQAVRRTRHAQQRREDKRPVQCAWDDARAADVEAFFIDRQHGTLIVRGPRSRVHAFARDGRHVTTFRLQGQELERRLLQRLWIAAPADDIADFRAALARLQEQARGTADAAPAG